MLLRRALSSICLAILISSTGIGQTQPGRYGDLWLRLSDNEKYFYVTGYEEGISSFLGESIVALAGCDCREPKEAALNRIQGTFQSVRVDLDSGTVAKVMTDIYKDPANVFIMFPQMVRLAIDKLKGKNIEEDIVRTRNSPLT
ncbi:MAG: hypothetical protein WAU45_18585 [Blastocatellia bacterium]